MKKAWKQLVAAVVMVVVGVMICRISPDDVERVASRVCDSVTDVVVGTEQRYIYYVVWDSATRQEWDAAQSEIVDSANDVLKDFVKAIVEVTQNPDFDEKYQKFQETNEENAPFIEMAEFADAMAILKDFNEKIAVILSEHGFCLGKDKYTDFMISVYTGSLEESISQIAIE